MYDIITVDGHDPRDELFVGVVWELMKGKLHRSPRNLRRGLDPGRAGGSTSTRGNGSSCSSQ